MKRALVFILLVCLPAFSAVNFTATLQNIDGTPSNQFIHLELRGCLKFFASNGEEVITKSLDLYPDARGIITSSVQDSSVLTCGNVTGSAYYNITTCKKGSRCPAEAIYQADYDVVAPDFNLNTATPKSVVQPVTLLSPIISGAITTGHCAKWISSTKIGDAGAACGSGTGGGGPVDWADITNKPTTFTPSAHTQTKSTITDFPTTWAWGALTGVPSFATVATSGSYTDLLNKPTIPAAQVQSDWNAVSGMGQILNKPTLFSGSYTDLTNKPTLAASKTCTGTDKFSAYDATTGQYTCSADQTGQAGGGITTLGASGSGQTGSSQILATANDTNVTLGVASATNTHTFTVGWQGTLSKARGGAGADMSSVTFPSSGTIATVAQIPDISGLVPNTRTVNSKALSANITLTTSDVADSADKRYVTDAQRTVLTNTSGTNTGDQDLSGLVPKTTTVAGHALNANVTVTKGDVGLGNVDNTSDASKPISTATQTALDGKAALSHTHTVAQITDFPTTWAYANITNIPFAIGTSYNGTPQAGTILINVPLPNTLSIPTNCTGSYLKAKTGATGSTTFTLYKNGVSFGTAVFSASGTSATFTCTATTFAAGDMLELSGGGDSTLANIGGAISGTK